MIDTQMVLTRDQLYDELHARLARPPVRLSAIERDAIAQGAAISARDSFQPLPFQIRPGLVAEMMRFYDQLRRQSQRVDRFEDLMVDALGGVNRDDRGLERLLTQTRFLASAFRGYERRVLERGACDEHQLREHLISEPARQPLRHLVVSVGDWIADPAGLFPADFDLLTRLPHLESIDIVCTDAILRSGFHERLHRWLPGVEEGAAEVTGRLPFTQPNLVCPPTKAESADLWFTCRDREEELLTTARRLKRRNQSDADFDRAAIVFKHPLPYLYLALDSLGAAGLPYHVSDALPLAAEPIAAAVDVVIDAIETRFSRGALVALLRSPHICFDEDGLVAPASIGALDRTLSNLRYLGDASRLEALARSWPADRVGKDAAPALRVALSAVRRLLGFLEPAAAADQVEQLAVLLEQHFSLLDDRSPVATREQRARASILRLLRDLSSAHRKHHNPPWSIEDLGAAIRRLLGQETFLVESGSRGVRLVDDQAARYGEYIDVTIVGLVENEWPDEPHRNVFYSSPLLKALGWPSEKDRRAAADAHFADLLVSSAETIALTTFTLDDDTPVARSLQLDEVTRAGLPTVAFEGGTEPMTSDELLVRETFQLDAIGPNARPWADMRRSRLSAALPQFHGQIGAQASRSWSISALETYLACPFKFFAQHVLRLEEEPDDEEVMDPRRRGQLVHEVFEEFFRAWQAAGNGQISAGNLEAARRMLVQVVDRSLASLSEGEAGLERTRILGSSAAAGLGEAVFRMEAERPIPVVERLLEHPLSGRFVMATASGPRVVELRGKADRLDLLADGTFRLVDYKLGWPPDRTRALQLPIYGVCAEQRLAAERSDHLRWTLGEAVYIAFGGPRRVVPLFTQPAERDEALRAAQQRLVDTIDAIDRGEFPPSPDDVYRCETCSFAAVCRKDYVGDV
jgi:RecB family exonuclease